ncbi:hypothetical protein EV361DRAFT_912344 [Lentinula raphanica]|nr:hypothetical protein F5880DRAFT_667471 [Lentinula raphanica]KAJ3971192.1 hypothetical protein EV361DRAFT_912344 [Lentinula raphanica]
MNDPLTPKRLSDAITMVGPCLDLCPRFERHRCERSNNLFNPWETFPPPHHKQAVGDKILPLDLRPSKVLKGTLEYLFGDMMVKQRFKRVYGFLMIGRGRQGVIL